MIIYSCLSIAYTWMIISGADCSKNKKSKIIGATKKYAIVVTVDLLAG
ncbi:hypothetical protein [Clostridium kluyveri]|nr:hypothetical protein [Clostridium kluyveri]